MTSPEPSLPANRLSEQVRDRIRLLIFDLDGVITSELPYWNAARHTVWEAIEGKDYLGLSDYFGPAEGGPGQWGQRVIPDTLVYEFKNRAVNSNWDLTFLAMSLYLLGVLREIRRLSPAALPEVFRDSCAAEEKIRRLGRLLPHHPGGLESGTQAIEQFLGETSTFKGAALLEHVGPFAEQVLGTGLSFFRHQGEFWSFCQGRFQVWLAGKQRPPFLTAPQQAAETAVDAASLAVTLKQLVDSGRYVLGVATGRPRPEAIPPLRSLGVLPYFDERRIVTNEAVEEAEAALARLGKTGALGKPHPFVLLKAIYPERESADLCAEPSPRLDHGHVAYVGDSASDVAAAKRAGCVSIGVLTGVSSDEGAREGRRKTLTGLGCDLILNSVLELPAALALD